MKKAVLVLLALAILLVPKTVTSARAAGENDDPDKELSDNVDDILSGLDTSAIDEFLSSLTEDQLGVFGSANILDKLKKIVSGEMKLDYSSFFGYFLEVIGVNFLKYLPLMLSVLAVAVAYNILNSVKGKFASDSVEKIVYFACLSLIVIIVFSQIFSLIRLTTTTVKNIQTQIGIFFPIILTMMTAIGASSSAAVYQPAIAVLSSGIAELMTAIILPCFILSLVFSVVGNLSEGIKLKNMSEFFSGATKWLLGTSFFIFVAFLSVQGITASVYDGVSVRTARFALSKYVPIIGGYLSEGFNLIMAGSVLIKNAVGMAAVILLLVTILPIVLQIVIFNLTLKLTAAVAEPLGDSKISSVISDMGKSINILIAIILGLAFLYFIFLILIVCTGNLAL